MAEIPHTRTLTDRAIGQSDSEEFDPAIRAGPRIVAVVAAMRAPPRHFGSGLANRIREFELNRKLCRHRIKDQVIRLSHDPSRIRFFSAYLFWDFVSPTCRR